MRVKRHKYPQGIEDAFKKEVIRLHREGLTAGEIVDQFSRWKITIYDRWIDSVLEEIGEKRNRARKQSQKEKPVEDLKTSGEQTFIVTESDLQKMVASMVNKAIKEAK